MRGCQDAPSWVYVDDLIETYAEHSLAALSVLDGLDPCVVSGGHHSAVWTLS